MFWVVTVLTVSRRYFIIKENVRLSSFVETDGCHRHKFKKSQCQRTRTFPVCNPGLTGNFEQNKHKLTPDLIYRKGVILLSFT